MCDTDRNIKILEKGTKVEHELFCAVFDMAGMPSDEIEYHPDPFNETWDCKFKNGYFQIKTCVPYSIKQAITIQCHQIHNYIKFAQTLNSKEKFVIFVFPVDDVKLLSKLRSKIKSFIGNCYVLTKDDILNKIPWEKLEIQRDSHGNRYIIPFKYFKIIQRGLDKKFPKIYNDLGSLGVSEYQEKDNESV
jgi:hypothetical protein